MLVKPAAHWTRARIAREIWSTPRARGDGEARTRARAPGPERPPRFTSDCADPGGEEGLLYNLRCKESLKDILEAGVSQLLPERARE